MTRFRLNPVSNKTRGSRTSMYGRFSGKCALRTIRPAPVGTQNERGHGGRFRPHHCVLRVPWPHKSDTVLYQPASPIRYRKVTEGLGVVGAIEEECRSLPTSQGV